MIRRFVKVARPAATLNPPVRLGVCDLPSGNHEEVPLKKPVACQLPVAWAHAQWRRSVSGLSCSRSSIVELTPFRGHCPFGAEGVHDADAISGGISPEL